MQSDGYSHSEVIHEATEGGAFFMHIEEDFADGAVLVFAGAEIEFMAADGGFLRVSLSSLWQAFA